MYKTEWRIDTEGYTATMVCYHFGKHPYFPSRSMVENEVYEIEMIWNSKLVNTPKIFWKCLFHKRVVTFIDK